MKKILMILICANILMAIEPIQGQDEKGWFIQASQEASYKGSSRENIISAKNEAILKAKASIAKYLSQQISTKESTQIQKESQSILNNDDESSNSSTLTNFNSNVKLSANELLKGAYVANEEINKEEKYVSVTVRIDEKSVEDAQKIKNAFNQK